MGYTFLKEVFTKKKLVHENAVFLTKINFSIEIRAEFIWLQQRNIL